MTKENQKILLAILLIMLNSVVTWRFTQSIYKTSDNIIEVTSKFHTILNENLKSNNSLNYRISPIGIKENELIYVCILEQKSDYSKDSSSWMLNKLDTTFYSCNHKNYFSNFDVNKIKINKNSSISWYLIENKFIILNSWFKL